MIAGVVRLLRDAGSCHGSSLSRWDVAPLSDAEKPGPRLSATFNGLPRRSRRAGSIS
jgi:hypothetical protein